MLDHIGIIVPDMPRALAFYDAALAPLGIVRIMNVPDAAEPEGAGFGRDGKPFFWLSAGAAATSPIHVAFAAPDRAAVEAFHVAALAAGARDNGLPGLRPHYHPTYYAAFVIDPDGHNIEAVTHHG
jgi:catechol 2,3-dioxygenase-like lactoylglutathione lyase family enzyme